ncbi:transcriptional regulator GutM [Staphylococcus delphini]|uniref:transcriptional regulator GutM n=1 Tax=Staphylococcus delphini TaxID=53344 RepID=UPI0023B3104F|nr:transcriptional regulator GutM [Staphylococcus delphini]MDE9789538.1 transcriptional regulator GutM [Staphylococcus delphini]MDE9792238.1 transcriptional regulator GutM [Staphylococcus delphini]MDE9794812.1 transcriptional regulator GutM [Staphylococcus delphini]MDE9797047.1 transcriptional regulator GutM [Staphylococcus delphini]
MFFILLIVLAAIGFVVQYLLGILQIKNFSKNYIELRKRGRVAIGRKPSIFRSGTLVLLQLNQQNVIESARYMQGVTVFAKFKELKGLEGRKLITLSNNNLAGYNRLQINAILDAKKTFEVIQSGGQVDSIPSPFMKVVKHVETYFKKARVSK